MNSKSIVQLSDYELNLVFGGEGTTTGRTTQDVVAETLDKAWEGLKKIGSVIHKFTCDDH